MTGITENSTAEITPWIGPDGQLMRRLELHLTYTCPERCVFCSEDHRMRDFNRFPVTWGRVARVLRTHAARGITHLHITGGEPSIHPRFIDVLALAKRLGMRTSVGSIGTMLKRPAFAARAMPLLDEALFSLHGPTAELHDALTRRAGSFDQVTAAITQAQALNPRFNPCVNSVLVRDNAEALPDTIGLADSLGARLIVVSNLTPEGAGLDNYASLAVPLERLAELIPRTVPRAKSAILRFFGVPYCLLGPHGMLSNDLHWDPRVTVEWTAHPGKVSFDDHWNWDPGRKRVYTSECEGCSMKGVCQGVFDRYAELWSTEVLSPPRSQP